MDLRQRQEPKRDAVSRRPVVEQLADVGLLEVGDEQRAGVG